MLDDIYTAIRDAGGTALVVGGYVRDLYVGLEPKDVDVEVYGLPLSVLEGILGRYGPVDLVGASFGVLRIRGLDVDFSIPRHDSKVGSGHKGFDVSLDPDMSVEDAASRRDYTMNTLALDPLTGRTYNPFGGIQDLDAGILRHTSDQFSEDPLRVLRGFQFCGRFNLVPAPETVEVCSGLVREYYTLARERVWGEWYKWASKSTNPSAGLEFLRQTGWVRLYEPLADIVSIPQDSDWHPEGGVWEHTCIAVDVAAQRTQDLDPEDRAVLVLAALLHDVGKARTTEISEGHIVSPGHAAAGASLAHEFLTSIGAPERVIERVVPLVREHMAHLNTPTHSSVRRLARRLHPATVAELTLVMMADHTARPPLPGGFPAGAVEIMFIADEVAVVDSQPEPIVMGRHLLEMGWTPGPHIGDALRDAFEGQLSGEFSTVEEGQAWVASRWVAH
jgi:tRNA nucleotidyltransferase (CCA-adding enzyme)